MVLQFLIEGDFAARVDSDFYCSLQLFQVDGVHALESGSSGGSFKEIVFEGLEHGLNRSKLLKRKGVVLGVAIWMFLRTELTSPGP